MKTLKFLSVLFTIAMALVFVSCDKTDEPDNNNGDTPGEVIGGDYEYGVWYEEGNKLIYLIEYDLIIYKYTSKLIFTFDGDVCIKAICENEFSDATMADIFYQELLAAGESATKSGKTVTIDYTEQYAGMSKSDLKAAISMYY